MSNSTDGGGGLQVSGPSAIILKKNFNNDKICLSLNHLIDSKHSTTLVSRHQAVEGMYASFI